MQEKTRFVNYYNIASKFVLSNSIARACFIFLLCTLQTSANISLEKKNFHRVKNVLKQLVHTSAVRLSRYEAFESITYESTLTHLSCFPNFPRASYLDERTLTYEPIVNCTPGNRASKMLVLSPDTGSNTKGFQVKQTL